MREGETKPSGYRFGNFELDTRSGELRKNGTRIRLQDQPLQILLLLLEHAGEVVTREQIQKKLWASDAYVDFDNAINSAMRKLREALSDDAGDPRLIETMARRGYRFIGSLEAPRPEHTLAQSEPSPPIPVLRESRKGVVVAICSTVLILALTISWWLWRPPGPVMEGKSVLLTPVPLTAALGYESMPSLSPDGSQVAYLWDEGKGTPDINHIYVKLIGEGKPIRLTNADRGEWSPSWSPDGRTIAFISGFDPKRRGIYDIPALGGVERQVAEGRFDARLSWSPDGRFLVATEAQPTTKSASLSLVRIENGDRVALTSPMDEQTFDWAPNFSPDGQSLVFTRCKGVQHCGLYLLDLAASFRPSGGPRLLGKESDYIMGSGWMPDGNEIVYAAQDWAEQSTRLMRIRVHAGSQPERLTFAGDHSYNPAVARRGNRLAYTNYLEDSDIWQVQPGKSPRSFISSTRKEDNPQYSPDGHWVAFSSVRTGLQHIWICDSSGRNPAQLTHFDAGASGTPRWSPDGRWIAFDHQDNGAYRIYVMASDGGQVRRLAQEDGDSIIPSWSTDGQWIYFANNRTGRYEIWKRPARGGEAIRVTHKGGWVAFESHDGHSLYYLKDHAPGLWKLSLGGGEEEKILESVDVEDRAFVVADDGIYYISGGSHDDGSVRFRSFATPQQDREIASVGNIDLGLTVSPDRKTILFTSAVRTGSNIMVVDNFR